MSLSKGRRRSVSNMVSVILVLALVVPSLLVVMLIYYGYMERKASVSSVQVVPSAVRNGRRLSINVAVINTGTRTVEILAIYVKPLSNTCRLYNASAMAGIPVRFGEPQAPSPNASHGISLPPKESDSILIVSKCTSGCTGSKIYIYVVYRDIYVDQYGVTEAELVVP